MTLCRPEGIPDRYWEAVQIHESRLDRAVGADDGSAVIGAAKELCESVATVVCVVLAQTVSTADEYGTRVSAAHAALDRRPGHGAAAEGAIRSIAQALRTLVCALGPLRNEVGTGHGRSIVPVVTGETSTMAEHAARLWSAWALARLHEVLRGEVAGLIRELESGGGWHRGLLAKRLEEVGLHSLHSEDQRRLGVAVAHRSSIGQTFVVSEAGVEPIRRDPQAWPSAYREGVAAGLLLNQAGRFSLREQYVEDLLAIVAVIDLEAWRELANQAVSALWTNDLTRDHERQVRLAELLLSVAANLDEARATGWRKLAERLRTGSDEVEEPASS